MASDKALLQAAADSLPEVARGRPEEVPDALRWARRVHGGDHRHYIHGGYLDSTGVVPHGHGYWVI